MKKYFEIVKDYISTHRKAAPITAVGVVCVVFLIALLVWNIRQTVPHIVYQPVQACDLLPVKDAQSLLGKDVINVEADKPVVSGDTATSKCSYSDTSYSTIKVAAVAVSTGINDAGTEQNKVTFVEKLDKDIGEPIKDMGDKAYFDRTSGKINILTEHSWIIVSYNVGDSLDSSTFDNVSKLAKIVLQNTSINRHISRS